jgi:uncharacterized protein YkvS
MDYHRLYSPTMQKIKMKKVKKNENFVIVRLTYTKNCYDLPNVDN